MTESQTGAGSPPHSPPLPTTEGDSEQPYNWRMFPMGDEPLKAVIFWPIVLLTIWGVYFATDGSGVLTFLAVVILFGSLTGYYIPTRFTIDSQGVHLQRWFYRNDGVG